MPKRPGVIESPAIRSGNQSEHLVVREMEVGSHDADHRALGAGDLVRAPDHPGVAGEPALPQGVADHCHARAVVVGGHATQDRLGTERGEERRRRLRHRHALDAIAHAQRRRERVVRGDVLQELRLRAVLHVELRRDAEFLREVGARRRGGDVDQAVGVREGKGSQQHRVDDAEHPRVGADGEAKRPDGDRREPGRAPQRARGMAEIPTPFAQRPRHDLTLPLWRRRACPRRIPALGGGGTQQVHAGGEREPQRRDAAARAGTRVVLPDLGADVGAELLPERAREESHEQREHGRHVRPWATPRRFSATAAVRFSRCASAASARRPAAVSV